MLYNILEYTNEVVLGLISLITSLIWLFVIIYRIYLTRLKYRQYSKSFHAYFDSHNRILYNLETFQYRDTLLIILIILEQVCIFTFMFGGHEYYTSTYKSESALKEVKEFFSCNVTLIPAVSYLHPEYTIFFILLSMMIVTHLMLISYINAYLAARYLGHSLLKSYKCKYILVWLFQFAIQLFFVIPRLQLLSMLVVSLSTISNWFYIIVTSRKVTTAIRLKIKEIRLFEWDAAQYRHYTQSLRSYRHVMFVVVTSIFLLMLIIPILTILFYLELILGGQCYFEQVYGISVPYNSTGANQVKLLEATYWVILTLGSGFGVLYSLPSIVIFIGFLVNSIHSRCTGKADMRRLTSTFFDPLIYQ